MHGRVRPVKPDSKPRKVYSTSLLHNLILVHSQNLLLRECRLSPFYQCSLGNLLVSDMNLVRGGQLTSTSASDPAATKPTCTGKKASASPSHLNSKLPEELSASTVSIVQMNAFRSARQSASPVTDGRELGLSLAEPHTLRIGSRNRDGDDDVAESEMRRFKLVLDSDV